MRNNAPGERVPSAELPADAGEIAVLLDVDGTLLEIAATPSSVHVDPMIVRVLDDVQRATGGALALITGRPISAVDELFAPLRLPVAGQHGLERRDAAGGVHGHPAPSAALSAIRARATAFAAAHPGVLVEDKGLTLAVHFRLAPDAEHRVRQLLEAALRDADGDLGLQAGKMVLEVKPSGRNKGTAIADFMAEKPFAGRVPVFVGDDVTDEYGFEVVDGLGGYSVKVGPGPSHARWRLTRVADVRTWLERVAAASTAFSGSGGGS